MKTHFFFKWSMTSEVIQGHIRSIFIIKTFLDIFCIWNLKLSKFGMNANIIKKHIFHNYWNVSRHTFIKWSMTTEVIQGHIRSTLYWKKKTFLDIILFVWKLKLSKFCMNANIIKRHIFHINWSLTGLKYNFDLVYNFCPCLFFILNSGVSKRWAHFN